MGIEELDCGIGDPLAGACPLCGMSFALWRWAVVNLDRQPALQSHAIDGSLQRSFCPRCIGPGIDAGGGFLLLRRAGRGFEALAFMPFGAEEPADAIDALHRRLRRQLDAAGAGGVAVEAVGSRLFDTPAEIEEFIDDCWPDLPKARVDPAMLAGPLHRLLSARDPRRRAEVLRADPDLARPNIEFLLDALDAKERPRGESWAATARSFIDRARSQGVNAVLHAEEADEAQRAALPALPPALVERWRALRSVGVGVGVGAGTGAAPAFEERSADGAALAQALFDAGRPDAAAEVLGHVGDMHRQHRGPAGQGGPAQAIVAYEQALAWLPPGAADTRWQLLLAASACWDRRSDGDRAQNSEQALACARQALALADALPADRQAEAAMETGLLLSRRVLGDAASNLVLARAALGRALDAATGDLKLLARYNLALCDVEDELDRSGDHLRRGLVVLRRLAQADLVEVFSAEQRQNLLQSLAVALAKQAATQPEQAQAQAQAALPDAARFAAEAHAIARQRGDETAAARLASLRARIEADRRDAEALDLGGILDLIDEAAAVHTLESAPYEYARNELRRASVLRDLGEPTLAGPLADRALERAAQVLTADAAPDLCRRLQSTLGRGHAAAGRWQAAALAYGAACDASERLLGWTETPGRRDDEGEPNAQLHAALVNARVELAGRAAEGDAAWQVLDAMEHGRARLYLDMMGLRPLPAPPGVPTDWIEQERQLIGQLEWSLPLATAGRDAELSAERLLRLRATRQALESLWDRIAASGEGGRRHVALRRARPPAREALAARARQLGSGVASLGFFVLPGRIVAVWLEAEAPPVLRTIEIAEADLRRQVLTPFERDVLADDAPDAASHDWLAFGEQLFAPFAERLQALQLLVLLPHGSLHGLPLHALTVRGRPLIAQVPVVYAPSLGVLDSVLQASSTTDRAGRGAPLVASHATQAADRDEFEAEARCVAGLNRAVARRQLRRDTLLAVAPNAPLIHLACHGHFDAGDALRSGVSLADGPMTAADWLSLRLRSDLVCLSACESGQQRVEGGDELLGLVRALLQAGSASALLTLWRVYSDTTVRWMSDFYAALERPRDIASMPGARPRWHRAAAFRAATLALRRRDPDPRAWAPFILAGDPG